MKELSIQGTENYSAYVVEIKNHIELDGCDNICGTIIFANHVIISKDTKIGTIGLYFPTETELSHDFLANNNLYRNSELNVDKNRKGFFESNKRIRAMKLRGFKSDGFFIPLKSLDYLNIDVSKLKVGYVFDTINNIRICQKHFPLKNKKQGQSKKNNKLNNRLKRFDKLIENQFSFHIDTTHLDRNIHKIQPDTLISITEKLHGSSFIVGKILTNKKLNIAEKILQKIGVNIVNKEYDIIYSSRKVIKNRYINKFVNPGFYKEDIWEIAANKLKDYLWDGMTIYGEIVGFTPEGKAIQSHYDYGCAQGEMNFYIYRITLTDPSGHVHEWSAKQVQQWCKQNGLKVVPELYYGYISDLFPEIKTENHWHENFLEALANKYLEKKCTICKNDVWAEGIVVRPESLDIEAYKFKSFNFKMMESKQADAGESNIEDDN